MASVTPSLMEFEALVQGKGDENAMEMGAVTRVDGEVCRPSL